MSEEKEIKKMPKKGSIAWHEAQIARKLARKSEFAKEMHKKRLAKIKRGYNNNYKTSRKKPLRRYRSRIEYDFLKYIKVVFKWANDNYPDLTRPQIELILYLYSLGAFSKRQFSDFHKIIGLYQQRTLNYFIKKGYVMLWRERNSKSPALYVVTQKGKTMCNKMHRYCCGVEEMPETKELNNMMKDDAPRINGYYMDIVKKMNKDKAPKDED